MKRQDKTTMKQIADYWIENHTICETKLNFDWADAHTHCWNCGDNKQSKSNKKTIRLERCHIVPHSLGGEDIPSNYMLLCNECHTEAPDVRNPKYMWEWLLSNRTLTGLTGTYRIEKALKLFETRKGYGFIQAMLEKKAPPEEIISLLKNEIENNITTHGIRLVMETYYSLLCEVEEIITKKYEVKA